MPPAIRVLLAQCLTMLEQLAQQRQSTLSVCAWLKAVGPSLKALGEELHIDIAAVANELEVVLAREADEAVRRRLATAGTTPLRQRIAAALQDGSPGRA